MTPGGPLQGIAGSRPDPKAEAEEEAAAPAGMRPVPMSRKVELFSCTVNIVPLGEHKQLQIVDPLGATLYLVTMTREDARKLAGQAVGGLELAGAAEAPPGEAAASS